MIMYFDTVSLYTQTLSDLYVHTCPADNISLHSNNQPTLPLYSKLTFPTARTRVGICSYIFLVKLVQRPDAGIPQTNQSYSLSLSLFSVCVQSHIYFFAFLFLLSLLFSLHTLFSYTQQQVLFFTFLSDSSP